MPLTAFESPLPSRDTSHDDHLQTPGCYSELEITNSVLMESSPAVITEEAALCCKCDFSFVSHFSMEPIIVHVRRKEASQSCSGLANPE